MKCGDEESSKKSWGSWLIHEIVRVLGRYNHILQWIMRINADLMDNEDETKPHKTSNGLTMKHDFLGKSDSPNKTGRTMNLFFCSIDTAKPRRCGDIEPN